MLNKGDHLCVKVHAFFEKDRILLVIKLRRTKISNFPNHQIDKNYLYFVEFDQKDHIGGRHFAHC